MLCFWLVLIMCFSATVNAFDNTSHFLTMDEDDLLKGRFLNGFDSRKPRFLNIQKINDDIVVRVEFGFQFISIPVKRVMNMANGMINAIPTFKFSLETLVVGLVMLFGVIVTVPALSNLLSVTHASWKEQAETKARHLDSSETLFNEFGEFIYPNSRMVELCTQRILCSWVKKVSKKEDQAEFENFLYSIINHKWFNKKVLNDTKLGTIIQSGIQGNNCNFKCKINQKTISKLSKSLTHFFE